MLYFWFHFPDSDVEHLVIYFLGILYVLFGGKIAYSVKNSMHFVYCIWIYKTQLPIHTSKQITEIKIIPFTIASKNKILRNIFKQGVERSMYENIQDTYERNV